MNRWIFLASVLLAGAAFAQGVRPSQDQIARFNAADANGDGGLDFAEMRTVYPDFTEREFQIYDNDGDGDINVYEFATVRLAAPIYEEGDGGEDRVDEAALEFLQLDLNRDGGISPAELLTKYPEAAASFDALDLDGDGVLSEAEFTGEASTGR